MIKTQAKKIQKKLKKSNKILEQSEEDDNDFIDGQQLDYGYEDSVQEKPEINTNGNQLITNYITNIKQEKINIQKNEMQVENLFADLQQQVDQDSLNFLNKMQLQKSDNKNQKLNQRTNDPYSQKKIAADLEMLQSLDAIQQEPAKVINKKLTFEFNPKIQQQNKQPIIIPFDSKGKKYLKDLNSDIQLFLIDVYLWGSKVYVFGVLESGQRVTIQVQQIQKCLYFILKDQNHQKQAERQIKDKLYQVGIRDSSGSFKKMKYCFQIKGIPKGDVLTYQVRYLFTKQPKQKPRIDWQGTYYKYVIGTTYTPIQLFLIKNKIKGPGWISLKKQFLTDNMKNSWTGMSLNFKFPETIQIPKDLDTIKIPELKVLTFSLKTAKPIDIVKKRLFPVKIKPEEPLIFCLITHYCPSYNIQFKPKKPEEYITVYYLSTLGKYNPSIKTKLIQCQTQQQLISCFLNDLTKYDPDFLCCHDASSSLDMLINRITKTNHKQIFRLGRLSLGRELGSNPKQRLNMLLSGRLLVDSYNHAKDMLKSVDYQLPAMSKLIPGGKPLPSIGSDEIKHYLDNNDPGKLISHTIDEAQCTFNLINHLQIIQLTRQLTNICGNIWRRSLQNARAERNEYLIMHECQKNQIIIPDKFIKEKDQQEDDKEKKKKYEGGLVLQPKKGLYTEFIVLLDFNSLYPSIIRQFNVCFSIIKRPALPITYYFKSKDHKKMQIQPQPEQQKQLEFKVTPPPKDQCVQSKWGFLPQLIHRIVQKRKIYKKLMKQATPQKYLVYDIVQKAYKLVANSIYGCLGFSNSRFYAKDLAALITEMGRKALGRGKQISQKMGVQVIYGDTDSLMLRIPDVAEQKSQILKIIQLNKKAQELRKQINHEYKMLQIDIDGVFKPILLLMKKKYVAKKLNNFDEVRLNKVEPNFDIEYKGIEVVRRDGCEISRRVSKNILDILLNNMTKIDQVILKIYDYLSELNQKLKKINPQKDYKDFLLAKNLNKHPDQYKSGAQRMPHIKVARDRMHDGQKAENLVNHAIYYLICKPRGQNHGSLADNAYDEKTFLRSQKNSQQKLEIDVDYYKGEQISPPLIRLLASIQQFKVEYMNEVMDMPQKYKKNIKKIIDQENEVDGVEQQIVIANKKEDVDEIINKQFCKIVCSNKICKETFDMVKKGILRTTCNQNCGKSFLPIIYNRIQNFMSQKINDFYLSKYKCIKCKKQYSIRKISCCGEELFKLTNASEVHNILYSLKKSIDYTENYENSVKSVYKKDSQSSVYLIKKLIDQFLKKSKFEKIDKGFMSRLKI